MFWKYELNKLINQIKTSYATGYIAYPMKILDVSHSKGNCLELYVIVLPQSSKSEIDGFDKWRKRLVIRVKAPPIRGLANKEAENIVQKITGLCSQVTFGHMSRWKTITVYGDPDNAAIALEQSVSNKNQEIEIKH